MGNALRRDLAWLTVAAALILVATKWPSLSDPAYWDENAILGQARFVAAHGLDLAALPSDVIKPPMYVSLFLPAVIRWISPGIFVLHLATCLLSSLTVPATFWVTRALGGSRRAALVAALLLGLSPLFFAQAGLALADAPVTLLCTVAWALLLRGRSVAFAVVAGLAVLTKESGYFLAVPAFVLLALPGLLRDGVSPGRWPAMLARTFPAFVPAVVLLGWLVAHRVLAGAALPPINRVALGARHLDSALVHDLVEGGRIFLVPFAAVAVWRGWRGRDAGVLATGVGVLALPFLFPAPLPRYMLPSLPLLCALAAMGIDRLRPWLHATTAAAWAALLLAHTLGWLGSSWHSNGGHHRDVDLSYRGVVAAQTDAARAVAEARPRCALAAFPMFFVLSGPREDGYPNPSVPTVLASDALPLEELCKCDIVVDATQGVPLDAALDRLRRAGALSSWRDFGPEEDRIRVFRVACPTSVPEQTPQR